MLTRQYLALILGFLLSFYSALPAQWTNYAGQPTARWGHACASYGGKIYSVSGLGWTTMEVFNPATNTWATLAPIPIGVGYPAVSGWNGKIYVMGGYVSSGTTNHQIYDIATNTWSTGAAMPIAAYGVASVAYNGRIYVPGGNNSGGTIANLQIYNVATNTWSAGAPMPTARYEYGIGLIGTDMYVFGGNAAVAYAVNESYNILTNTWTTRASMGTTRYINAGASDGAKLHAAGGYPNNATYESYNPATNTWTAGPSMAFARYRTAGAVANSCFFVISGFNGSVPISNVEGFCGLVVLPIRHDLHLQAADLDGRVGLTWDLPTDLRDIDWQVERSVNGLDFERIGNARAVTDWLDAAPPTRELWYRLSHTSPDGDVLQSNIAEVVLTSAREPQFTYAMQEAWLHFLPATSAPGIAQLWSADGKMLRQSQWPESGNGQELQWSLSDFAAGMYIFTYQANGVNFQRKVMKL